MADMYGKRERGKAVAIASFLPYLGPALGPIVGGVVAEKLKWQWMFWILCGVNAATTLVGIVLIRESYTPVLLRRKTRQAQLEAESKYSGDLPSAPGDSWRAVVTRIAANLWRPCRLLLTRPIVQIIGLIMGLNFAIYALILGTFATLFTTKYAETAATSSLNYIAIALGAIAATQGGGHLMDRVYRCLAARNGGRTKPEFRVPYVVPGVVLVAVGLFVYGWTAEFAVAWPVVDLGAAGFTLGSFVVSQMLYAYLLDEFLEYSASAMAAARLLSYVLGFVFPIFAPGLYDRLGYGWGNSLLGFLWIVLCFPMPFVLWRWGVRLRAMGKGAKDGRVEGV